MSSTLPAPRILAELLRIQRWAGGNSVPADRIFGLLHGFESVIREESESFGINEETQRKVEDLLQDIDEGKQTTNGMALKQRMKSEEINLMDASRVIELCQLQGRFSDAIEKIVAGKGTPFSPLARATQPELDWFGALHYMELVDCTAGARKKMHAVFAPAIPRIGEIVTPQHGSTMQVVGVEHCVADQGAGKGIKHHILIPYVLLEMIDDTGEDAG